MSTTEGAATGVTPLPAGTWRVDPTRSKLAFSARGTFGLLEVRGEFTEYTGELTVEDGGARGELRIKAGSLDTGNARRDKHLRSADFFDVANHDVLTFTLLGVTGTAADGLALRGVLSIRGTELELTSPLAVSAGNGELTLGTELEVDRAAAGVGWSKAGMIKGPAALSAALTLVAA